MNRKAQVVLQEALGLTEDERADLAGAIIESLETSSEPDVENGWRTEVAERVKQLDAGSVETIPWESIRESMMVRLGDRSQD